LRGATPKLLDGSTFESMSPEELEQAEEEVRQEHLKRHPEDSAQFAGELAMSWNRRYDFKNIFAENVGVVCPNFCYFFAKM
jgi:hypothetical protein